MKTPLDSLREKEAKLEAKLKRIPQTFSPATQAEATERAKRHLSDVQTEIREASKQEKQNDKKTTK